jgi:hypothetical protein
MVLIIFFIGLKFYCNFSKPYIMDVFGGSIYRFKHAWATLFTFALHLAVRITWTSNPSYCRLTKKSQTMSEKFQALKLGSTNIKLRQYHTVTLYLKLYLMLNSWNLLFQKQKRSYFELALTVSFDQDSGRSDLLWFSPVWAIYRQSELSNYREVSGLFTQFWLLNISSNNRHAITAWFSRYHWQVLVIEYPEPSSERSQDILHGALI